MEVAHFGNPKVDEGRNWKVMELFSLVKQIQVEFFIIPIKIEINKQ
jgi:hypothetical protein